MLQMLRHDDAHRQLSEHGWARLPKLDPVVLDRLHGLCDTAIAGLRRHALSSDIGFDELWGHPDLEYRTELQGKVAEIVRPALRDWFVNFRPILHNIFAKRSNSPRSAVPFHRDFAAIDERTGDMALQIWIPLVDVAPENGALIMVTGSHTTAPAIRPHDSRNALSDHPVTNLPPGAVQPLLRAGEGVVFTNGTIHASTANASPRDRPAIGCIIVPQSARITNWVARAPRRMELWAMSDSDFLALEPGRLPPGATLIEVTEGS